MNKLGKMYLNGDGVGTSYSKAVKWFEKAMEYDCVDAVFNLGYCYENAKGVKQSYSAAKKLYEKAANLGNEEAIEALDRLNA